MLCTDLKKLNLLNFSNCIVKSAYKKNLRQNAAMILADYNYRIVIADGRDLSVYI